jgi:8-oxo-dGTP diphosphatase
MEKVGMAVWRAGSLLTVRKHRHDVYILPGGKRESADANIRATLRREIREELCCDVDERTLEWVGTFRDESADDPTDEIAVHLFVGELVGDPRPCSEIDELRWFDPSVDDPAALAPSIRNEILPHFLREEPRG